MYLEYLDTKRTRKYKMQCATYRLLTWTYQSLTRWRTRASSNFVDRSLAMSSPGRRQDRGGRAFQDFLRPVWDERFFENLLSKKKVGNNFFSLQPLCSFVISDDSWLFSPPDFPPPISLFLLLKVLQPRCFASYFLCPFFTLKDISCDQFQSFCPFPLQTLMGVSAY